MEENRPTKISFFDRFKTAIFNLEDYDFFAVENSKFSFAYFAKLILIFSLIISIGVTYKLANTDINAVPELREVLTDETVEYIGSIPKIELYIIFYIICAIYLYIIYFITAGIDVLLLSLLGLITSKIARAYLKYMPILRVSIYSLTLPITLNAIYILINSFTGFEIKYFQIMYNLIAYIYLITAIFMIKSEMIKQETELAKLAEEEQKIREEMKKKQEEEKQQDEQKRKEREKEKEEKKKEKENENKEKQNNGGETPEGANAFKTNWIMISNFDKEENDER